MKDMKVILISGKAGHGKDTAAQIMKEELEKKGKTVLITHFGDLLKYICKTFFNWNGEKDEAGRTLLQWVGTDKIRTEYPNFWAEFIRKMLTVFNEQWDYVIIPDCRFPNEISEFEYFNKITIRVERLDYISNLTEEQQNHPSETALDNYTFDWLIQSKSGLEHLKQLTKIFIEECLDV